jgi:hypothetical protein
LAARLRAAAAPMSRWRLPVAPSVARALALTPSPDPARCDADRRGHDQANRRRRKAIGFDQVNDVRVEPGVPREPAIEVTEPVSLDFGDQLKQHPRAEPPNRLALPLSAKSGIKRSSRDPPAGCRCRRRRRRPPRHDLALARAAAAGSRSFGGCFRWHGVGQSICHILSVCRRPAFSGRRFARKIDDDLRPAAISEMQNLVIPHPSPPCGRRAAVELHHPGDARGEYLRASKTHNAWIPIIMNDGAVAL